MDLNYVKFTGFKRFEKATLNTSGKIIAILGANEAGKSSILQALPFLNNDIAFNKDIHLTRNNEFSDEDIILEAGFLLDDEDKKAISDLYKIDVVRWFYIKKPVSGKRKFEIIQSLPRNNSYKDEIIDNFNNLISKVQHFAAPISIEMKYNVKEKCEKLIKQLEDVESNRCSHNTFQNIFNDFNEIAKDLNEKANSNNFNQQLDTSNIIQTLDNNIENFLDYYNREKDSNQKAIDILKERIPKFLLFTEASRDLQSNFNLATLDKTKPNQALNNLLKIANLDIDYLKKIINNHSIRRSTINKGNKRIKEIYEDKWSQSQVKPVLEINGNILRIFFENKGEDAFEIKQRSDGLRQFVALINFLEIEHTENPILLIDEAELHLHYDAQADLIKIFTQQKFASKIIYTTHSVGCLPEDLGKGVKIVLPEEDKEERSTIESGFWSVDKDKGKNKRPGILPLLFSMGASQLTFMAIRECVFVEGATDMLLLPTLFRQAIEKDYLGFQIVKGIANTSNANLGLLENHAPKVAFLVDNDSAGKNYIKNLKKLGIEEARIFQLPHPDKMLEDYIEPKLYIEAVNKQIKIWNKEIPENCLISLKDIPDINSPQYVKDWCFQHKFKEPSKVEISYYLLDLAVNERQEILLEKRFKDSFITLYHDIIRVLKL